MVPLRYVFLQGLDVVDAQWRQLIVVLIPSALCYRKITLTAERAAARSSHLGGNSHPIVLIPSAMYPGCTTLTTERPVVRSLSLVGKDRFSVLKRSAVGYQQKTSTAEKANSKTRVQTFARSLVR
jgi:hypothetical protein